MYIYYMSARTHTHTRTHVHSYLNRYAHGDAVLVSSGDAMDPPLWSFVANKLSLSLSLSPAPPPISPVNKYMS